MDDKTGTSNKVDPQPWPQAWDWEEFLFGGRLHRCGYAADNKVMVLVVALGSQQTSFRLTH